MGVKGLYSYLRHHITWVSNATRPRRIGFDAMSIIYKYKGGYHAIFPILRHLQECGHTLLFVFDGKPPIDKEGVVKERRDVRTGAIEQAAILRLQLDRGGLSPREQEILRESIRRLETQGWHMSREIRLEIQRELLHMSIPFVQALGEADMALVDLCAAGKLDVVVSTDMDFLLSGVPCLWIPFRGSGGGGGADGFEQLLLKDVLAHESMTEKELLDAGILCGVEALRGRLHINSHTAFSWIRHYRSIEAILKSSIQNPQLVCFQDSGLLVSVRQSYSPHSPWNARIRPDHVERFKEFLTLL